MTVSPRFRQQAFTLIELMITVAIVAILARIAYGSYTESVNRSKRSQAQTAILGAAQALERYYTKNNGYTGAAAGAVFPANVPATGVANYTLSVVVADANTYTITATRSTSGSMMNDACGDFTYASSGSKGLASNTKAVADCWK